MSSQEDWEKVKEEVRNRTDIVSVVRDYVRLEEKGSRYWALCPFHAEDTASFAVTPEMGIFKCFGCGKGGDVFSFIMEIEGCEFPEALRQLADRCGVELPSSDRDPEEMDRRQQLFEINRYAGDKYQYAFWNEPGEKARKYMQDRGFSRETLEDFEVGYAPEGWDNLLRALKRDGYDLDKARELGLVSTSSGNVFDMFRDRVIFPIHDLSARIVGFGGRALDTSGDTPKYLNTPETPVFSKGRILYGLTQARSQIRDSERCLVMEGYTDVMRCHEAGFDSAVAALGTALTEKQVRLLKRYAEEVVLVYDGDNAGKKAARRGGEIALKNGLDVSVIELPPGADPADVISESPEKFRRQVEGRRPFLRVLYDWLAEEVDVDRAAGKEKILKVLLPLVKQLPGRIQKEEQVRWLANRLGTDEALIFQQLSSISIDDSQQLNQQLRDNTGQSLEEIFFATLARHPEPFDEVMEKISRKDFYAERSNVLMKALIEIKNTGEDFTPQRWLELVPADQHSYLAGLLSLSDTDEIVSEEDPLEVASMLKESSNRRERAEIARTLSEQDRANDPGRLDEAKKALLEQTIEMKRKEENQN